MILWAVSGLVAGAIAIPWLVWNLRLGFLSRIEPRRKVRTGRDPLRRCQRAFEEFTIETADGVTLRGWYVPGQPDRPTFVLCHAHESSKHSSLSRLALLPRDCPALLFDYRAHGESEGQASMPMHGEWMDLEAVLGYAHEQIGAERMILWGRCWSTLVVANLAARRKDIEALVLEGSLATFWDAVAPPLERRFGLPAWCFCLGIFILRRRWMRGLRCRPLPRLAREMAGKRVLLLTAGLHRPERRFANCVRSAWSRTDLRELRMPALHGEVIDLAAMAMPYRVTVEAALRDLASGDSLRRVELAKSSAPVGSTVGGTVPGSG